HNREKIIEDYKSGLSYKEIQEKYGVKYKWFHRVLRNNAIELRGHKRKFTQADENSLVEKYQNGSGINALVREYKTSAVTIKNILNKRGIDRKKIGGQPRKWSKEDIEKVIKLYDSGKGLSQQKIAQIMESDQRRISVILRQNGVSTKRISERHPNWKGGRIIDESGYVRVLAKYAGKFAYEMSLSDGYVFEHRAVMAQYLGRPLRKNETVHHIDGNRSNNNIENLQLRIGNHGKGAAFQCLDCSSHNIKAVKIIEC
ncbi:MAG TPA: HNH endonuclease signature motif containing protein, partial [Pyrinomonadaceae bacterium]